MNKQTFLYAIAWTQMLLFWPAFSIALAEGPPQTLAPGKMQIFSASEPVRKIVLNEDGTYWVLFSRSTVVEKRNLEGRILDGIDVSSLKELPSDTRVFAQDLDAGPGGMLYILVGRINPANSEIGNCFVLLEEEGLRIIELQRKMFAYKGQVDAAGNLYILGLDEDSGRRVEQKREKGEYRIVHKFAPDGSYVGSFLSVMLDPTTEEDYIRKVSSPFHHRGNFVVGESGEIWVLWSEFPASDRADRLQAKLFRGNTAETLSSYDGIPPRAGCFPEALLQQGTTSEPVLAWNCAGVDQPAVMVLTTINAGIFLEGDFGGILAVNEGVVLTSVLGGGLHKVRSFPLQPRE